MFKTSKTFTTLVAGLMLSSSVVAPVRSEAGLVVAALSGGYGTIGLIIPFIAGTSSAAAAIEFFRIGFRSTGFRALGSYSLSVIAGFTGYILLDSGNRGSAELGSLSREQARALGLSDREWSAYEFELAQLNALREESVRRTLDYARLNPTASDAELVGQLSSSWKELTALGVDPAAVAAVTKISDAVVSSLRN